MDLSDSRMPMLLIDKLDYFLKYVYRAVQSNTVEQKRAKLGLEIHMENFSNSREKVNPVRHSLLSLSMLPM